MAELHNLAPAKTKSKRRLGRGYGSQKGGHTSSRGQKGQKARSKVPIWFEGGQLPLIRRTPFIKGKSRFKSLKPNPVIVTLTDLEKFKTGDVVTLETLGKTLKIAAKTLATQGAKILNNGKLTKSLTVKVAASKTAIEAIKKAGGQVE